MRSLVKLVRLGFEAAGAVQLLLQAGAAAVIAVMVGYVADIPLGPRIVLFTGVFLMVLAAFLAYLGAQVKNLLNQDETTLTDATASAETSGDHSPAASAHHSGTGDISIDQSTHHHAVTVEESLPFGGDPFIQKSAEEIIGFYEKHTDLQADRLVEIFLGRPIQVTGVLFNVSGGEGRIQVQIMLGGNYVTAWFSSDWLSRLAELDKMTTVTIVGRLREVGGMGISLDECELVQVGSAGQLDLDNKPRERDD